MITFRLGESRNLDFEITYTKPGQTFVVDTQSTETGTNVKMTSYVIFPVNTEMPDERIPLTVDSATAASKHILSTAAITPEEVGNYILDIRYKVGATVKKARYQIGVIE